ncbi:phosphatase PAP2 family protein [Micromonospora sp. NPDC051227]|uniref:phosphatase PAP2 family protein n=1 Tax=Micromonospora sp. NPDC051227 TaxID=3364285 RepID=UPI0037A3B3E8
MTVVAVPLAALAALSRVVVGVHYPHDVLGGTALGVARDHCSRSSRSGLTHVPPGRACTPTTALKPAIVRPIPPWWPPERLSCRKSDSRPRRDPGTTPATHPTGAQARHFR